MPHAASALGPEGPQPILQTGNWESAEESGLLKLRKHTRQDFESEVFFVPQTVGSPLDYTNLIVQAFDESQRDFVLRQAVRRYLIPMTMDHVGELFIWFKPLPLERCAPVVEESPRPALAHLYMPGTNPFVTEFADRYRIPQPAVMGGAETMYPEYRLQLLGRSSVQPLPAGSAGFPRQSPASVKNDVEILHVQGNVHVVVGPGGNMAVQAGPQGLFVVDTMTPPVSEKVLAAIGRLSNKKIRHIVNTSSDPDHTGGNEVLRKAGITIIDPNAPGALNLIDAAAGAAIIAHENVLKRMSSPSGRQPAAPFNALPTSTFLSGAKTVFFNDEPVIIMRQPAAHSDGDAMVFFRRSDVIATGDIFSTTGYPVIDIERGGTIQGIIDGLNRIIELAVPAESEEGGTLVIPGHGRLCDRSDVVVYRDMVVIVRNRIQEMKKSGMTVEEIRRARPTLDYDPQYGAASGPWTTDMFVEAVYKSLQ